MCQSGMAHTSLMVSQATADSRCCQAASQYVRSQSCIALVQETSSADRPATTCNE